MTDLNLHPKVSVIIPNYNHERFLRRRVESVLNQTFSDFEIIYIDDASSDGSNKIFAEFAEDPRIRTVLNKINSGIPFKQWNKGVELARGEYIWIAESDDFAEPTFLEKLVGKLEANRNVGLAFCRSVNFDENDKQMGLWKPHGIDPAPWDTDFVKIGAEYCLQHFLTVNTIPNASAVVFRKQIYIKAGKAPENMRLAGDWLVWLKMLLISDIGHLAEPLNYFRRSSQSISVNAFVSSLRVKEKYCVADFILSNFKLSKSMKEEILDKLMLDWKAFANSERWWKLLGDNISIFLLAAKIDSKILRRLGGKR